MKHKGTSALRPLNRTQARQARTNRVSILLNDSEMRALDRYCERYGVKNRSRLVREILMRKAREGVEVRLLYDNVGSRNAHQLFFDEMTERDIQKYIDSGEPSDKAGAYAIQGKASAYIKGIEGDYFNVVGLPAHLLLKTLKEEFKIEF